MNESNTTLPSIHGHDVLDLIHQCASSGTPLSREALAREIEKKVGAEVRFHTCSAQQLTLGELLDFLLMRGKILEREGKLAVDMTQVCNH